MTTSMVGSGDHLSVFDGVFETFACQLAFVARTVPDGGQVRMPGRYVGPVEDVRCARSASIELLEVTAIPA